MIDIKTQLLQDVIYASGRIIYLNTIILCYLDEAILQTSILSINQCISPSARKGKFNSDWYKLINHDSNIVTTINPIYNSSHNVTYFKYTLKKNKQYQYDFPYQIINLSFVG